MNNDLISRSALKKAIGDLYGSSFEEMTEDFTWLKAIDNTPSCNRDCKDCPDKTFDSDSSQEFICDKDGHVVR